METWPHDKLKERLVNTSFVFFLWAHLLLYSAHVQVLYMSTVVAAEEAAKSGLNVRMPNIIPNIYTMFTHLYTQLYAQVYAQYYAHYTHHCIYILYVQANMATLHMEDEDKVKSSYDDDIDGSLSIKDTQLALAHDGWHQQAHKHRVPDWAAVAALVPYHTSGGPKSLMGPAQFGKPSTANKAKHAGSMDEGKQATINYNNYNRVVR